MIPHFAEPVAPMQIGIPDNFIPVGTVRRARLANAQTSDPFRSAGSSVSGSAKSGLVYEASVLSALVGRWDAAAWCGPWIEFADGAASRRCQPDAIVSFADPARVVVCEIKAMHTERAWWQLRRLYQPVVQVLLPDAKVFVLEICRDYDPQIACPELKIPITSMADVEALCEDQYYVLRWRPGDE